MSTTVFPIDVPPPSTYLGDGLYADFPGGLGLVRVWIRTNGQVSPSFYFGPDSLGALLNYAARCYAPLTGANDDEHTH